MKHYSDYVIALDVGGTNMRAALVTGRGRILFSTREPTKSAGSRRELIDQIARLVAQCSEHSKHRVSAVGIGFPGPLNAEEGFILSPPNLPALKQTPLKKILVKRLRLPVFVENDANAAALGEYRFGVGKGAHSLVCLTLGTGIGGGIILNGEIWHGAGGVAGEAGHIKIVPGGRKCGCGGRGCLEQYASATGLVRTAKDRLRKNRKSLILKLAGGKPAGITALTIFRAAGRGDALAVEVLRGAAGMLALAIANILSFLNPEIVVIGGGLANAGKYLFQPLRRQVGLQTLPDARKNVKIVKGKLGDRAGILGAAAVAFARLKAVK